MGDRMKIGLLLLSAAAYGGDTRFSAGRSALAIPFESENDVISLHVRVNDSRPLTFLLDTGASYSILNLPHAKSFGLELQPLGKVDGGFGNQPPEAYLATDSVALSLPGIVLASQSVRAMTLDKVQECIDKGDVRRVVDGILGADFFSNLVVEIDYEGRLINLYDPAGYRYKGKGKTIALEKEGYIFVRAQVTGSGHRPVGARLIVDTGASLSLSLRKDFSETHGILPGAGELAAAANCGIGGFTQQKSWFGSLEALQLGSFRVSRPATMFYEDADTEGYDGAIGGAAFRHAKVIFDYSRSRMIVESSERRRK
jgi:hypothetical protein